jgi:hypothetical protein
MIALLAGLWLIAGGVLGMRHEAHVTHVLDGIGQAVHAAKLTGAHEAGSQSDIHGQADRNSDHGLCAVSTTLHQAGSPEHAKPEVSLAPPTWLDSAATHARIAVASRHVYRLAPKTSPPVA